MPPWTGLLDLLHTHHGADETLETGVLIDLADDGVAIDAVAGDEAVGAIVKAVERVAGRQIGVAGAVAVSLQIKRLEDQMGQALLERTNRSVLLTAPGERLLPYARHMLKLEDEARGALSETQRSELIRFATSEEQAAAYLPALLPRYAERFPDTRLEIQYDMSASLVKRFQEGLLDVVLSIRHLPTQSGQLLGWEPMVWVVAKETSPASWVTLPLTLNPEGYIFRAHAFSALGRKERCWEVHYSSQSPTGVNLPVQAGLAMTVKPPAAFPRGAAS